MTINIQDKTTRVVLGIDPGFGSLGYAVITEKSGMMRAIDYGCLKTPASDSFPSRLNALFTTVTKLITTHCPSRIGVEKLFFEKNTKTAIDVAQARGVILLACCQSAIPIIECTPLQVKLAATGYGKAEKKQVQHMMKLLLGLPVLPKQDDAADALAIAYCAFLMSPATIKNIA